MATGLVHQLVGVAIGFGWLTQPGTEGRVPFAEIAAGGFFGAVEPDPLRIGVMWFWLFGFVLIALGSAVRHFERRGEALPASLGWQLGGLSLLGVALFPASGFWLVLPQAGLILWRARRG